MKNAPLQNHDSKNNLEPSKDQNYFFFHNFPGLAGITTINFGSLGRPNNDRLQLFEKLMDLTDSNYYIKIGSRHKNKIISVNHNCQNYLEADAVVYQSVVEFEPLIMISTADCPIVIITDQKGNAMGIIRASWREIQASLITKIAYQLHYELTSFSQELSAWVWPGICPNCLPLNQELKNFFPKDIKHGKLDLKALIFEQLLKSGIAENNISSTSLCSKHSRRDNQPFFYSKRRQEDGNQNVVFVKLKQS
jgi:copper oxidase (laccase) domain-containing protein